MNDNDYMALALNQARLGLGQTSPNPAVGAVLVHGDQVVDTGYHVKVGTAHAERVAISNAEAKGFQDWEAATLYVTLEPCSTAGRTGACSDAIVSKKIGRVVYGSVDPNPAHAGQADAILLAAGIACKSRVLEKDCNELIRGFRKVQEQGMPWVIMKTAMSLDGKITRPSGEGQWLTSEESRHEVHFIRAEVDAIITGGNTLRTDNPSLTVRLPGRAVNLRQPKRVVLTRDRTALPAESTLMQDEETLVYETDSVEDIALALKDLASTHGVNTVLVEAGGELLGQFCDADLVDEVVVFYAPMLTGGPAQAVAGQGATSLSEVLKLDKPRYQKIGDDVMLRANVKKDQSDNTNL